MSMKRRYSETEDSGYFETESVAKRICHDNNNNNDKGVKRKDWEASDDEPKTKRCRYKDLSLPSKVLILYKDRIALASWTKKMKRNNNYRNCQPFHFYPTPAPVWVTGEPKVDGLPYVPVLENEFVKVKINDKSTFVVLDSGCTHCFMDYEVAERLSLLDKVDPDESPLLLDGWGASYSINVKKLHNQPCELEDGGKLYLDFKIEPKGEKPEGLADTGEILVGQNVLSAYKALQTFEKGDEGYLYFKDPELLNKPVPGLSSQPPKGFYINGHYEKSRHGSPVSMYVDTGVQLNYISSDVCEQRSLEQIPSFLIGRKMVKAKIYLSGGCNTTTTLQVEKPDQMCQPIVLGKHFLAENGGVLDYAENILYLHTSSKRHKIQLAEVGTHELSSYSQIHL